MFILQLIFTFQIYRETKPYTVYLLLIVFQFSVPQIEYPLGGSSKKGGHVYFLLQVFWVILLFCQIVLLFDINVVMTSQ